MSRRAAKIEKRVTLDPKYNSELVAHMIRVIMKDGKKSVAEKIVYGAIDKIKEAVAADPSKFVKEDKTFTDVITYTFVVRCADEEAFLAQLTNLTDGTVEPLRYEELYLAWPEEDAP